MAKLTKQKNVYREGQPDEKVEWLLLDGGKVVGRFQSEQEVDEVIATGNTPFPT